MNMKTKLSRGVLSALCLALLLTSCGKGIYLPLPEDCAYAVGDYVPEQKTLFDGKKQRNTFGNSPFSTVVPNRRVVAHKNVVYSAVNPQQRLERIAADGSATVLFDEAPVGQLSFYDGHIYFSNYVLQSPNGDFDSTALYRMKPGEAAEKIYEARAEVERFSAFQLCNGWLYLTGSREFHTFGVKRLSLDGKTGGNLLSSTEITQVQATGGAIYFLQGEKLYGYPVQSQKPVRILPESAVKAYCVDGGKLYYTAKEAEGLFCLDLATNKSEALTKTKAVDAFFAADGALYFTAKPQAAAEDDLHVALYRLKDGIVSAPLAENLMPNDLSYLQPIFENGRLYYFGWEAAHGYEYSYDLTTDETALWRDWDIPAKTE
ncbi:MAG: DUF5050 domain-containing protein [Oscillospiraceae bacterium]|jgi:hypothetical protein|nr:DUF5050 domain-containing protein [Oscillospiraceae bacterium]